MEHFRVAALLWFLHIHLVLPLIRDRADLMVAAQPVETMQIQSCGRVDILRCESIALAAVPEHQGTPILFGVGTLRLTKKLNRLTRRMLMLNAHHRKS